MFSGRLIAGQVALQQRQAAVKARQRRVQAQVRNRKGPRAPILPRNGQRRGRSWHKRAAVARRVRHRVDGH